MPGVQLRNQAVVLIKSQSHLVLTKASILVGLSLAQSGARLLLHQRVELEAEAERQEKQFSAARQIGSAPWIAAHACCPGCPQPWILESISPIRWFNFIFRTLLIKDNMLFIKLKFFGSWKIIFP